MMPLEELLARLFADYLAMNPQAKQVYRLLADRGEHVQNDHIALRGIGDPRLGIDVLAQAFEQRGYARAQAYAFPDKHLRAWHFQHARNGHPKIFISELVLEDLPDAQQSLLRGLLDSIPPGWQDRPDLLVAGRPWELSIADYETLRAESDYAAWVAAHGLRVNHFTIDVNSLRSFDDLDELNHFLAEQGIPLNQSGGLIKGSREDLLQQSSTRAGTVPVAFSDGTLAVPGCYVEFAQRFRQADGSLFQGFIARSADRIFESTDAVKPVTTRIRSDEVKRRLKG